MSKDHRTEDGRTCTADDPNRSIWYGHCGYWTDDWNKVRAERKGGIPRCPTCRVPGFITTAKKWLAGVERYESEGNPNYGEFIDGRKETCMKETGVVEAYELWKGEQDEK